MSKPALGRGLGALLGGSPVLAPTAPAPVIHPLPSPARLPVPDARDRVQRVPLDRIRPCPLQPRKDFSPESLRELADSIREQGIVQPLVVRDRNGFYELIAGERRWRAAQLLNLPEVPVIVREADDRAALELALIENLQRENLNALEEAHGYAELAEQFQLTQEEIAAKVGKGRVVVANALRLLKLRCKNAARAGRHLNRKLWLRPWATRISRTWKRSCAKCSPRKWNCITTRAKARWKSHSSARRNWKESFRFSVWRRNDR